ncbi:MAG: sigma-54-dependent Fis family transcriptional regulator [bacterium]|nr:sigma-54-dependent Fis family transcriptional regulator [bacterium]
MIDASVYPAHPVLIVDDEAQAVQTIVVVLRANGITNVTRCMDSREVMGLLAAEEHAVVLLDLTMPHVSGETLLPRIAEEYPRVPVIVVTGMNDVDTAVRCMSQGAFDYMVKPVEEQRLTSGVRRAIEMRSLESDYTELKNRMLTGRLEQPEAFADILTGSPKMLSVFRYAETVARSTRPVLISGETGVGKELLARAVHGVSGLQGPFMPVNAAGLDDTMFSDALFGHVRGAFTGADVSRPGILERARGGTVFLDEIGDLRMESQVKLLRLLQEREYLPLGADAPKESEARIVLATHRDLERLVEEGRFRKDLYYRLQVHRIHIPPLRDRLEDVPLLLDHFLGKAAEALGKPRLAPPSSLLPLLRSYGFPGNVRELEAIVFDAAARAEGGVLALEALREQMEGRGVQEPVLAEAGGSVPFAMQPGAFPTIKEATEYLVQEALDRSSGNQTIASQLLGITPSALNKRLKRAQGR